MPVLLLARGDAPARDLLRAAIEARYGFRPPALETLRLEFKGRVLARIWPASTWLPLRVQSHLKFPNALYWDYVVRPVGLPLRRGALAFDGETLRHREAKGRIEPIADTRTVEGMRQQIWAMNAVLLMPLTEQHVELHSTGDHAFDAIHRTTGDTAQLTLNPDNTLSQVQITTYHPEKRTDAEFKLKLSGDYTTVNDLILPSTVTLSWNDEPFLEMTPTAATINPVMPDTLFKME